MIDIARKISKKIKKISINRSKSNDKRSYRLDSTKLLLKGYKRVSNISDVISKLQKYYSSKNFRFSDNMIRIKYLKKFLNGSK